jgi:hypothetical protein
VLEKQQEQLNRLEKSVNATGGSQPRYTPNQNAHNNASHSGSGVRNSNVICFKCSGRGHIARLCPSEAAGAGQRSGQQSTGKSLNYKLP